MNTFESLAADLLKAGLQGLAPTSVSQSLVTGVVQGAVEALSNPQVQQGLNKMLDDMFVGSFCHSGLDVAQDALDACEHGQMSHDAALKIVAIALDDDMKRKQRRIN